MSAEKTRKILNTKKEEVTSFSIFCEAGMKEKIMKYMNKTFHKLMQYDSRYLEDQKRLEQEEEKLRTELSSQQIKMLNNIMEYHRSCIDNVCILSYISGILDGKKSLKKISVKLKDILFL